MKSGWTLGTREGASGGCSFSWFFGVALFTFGELYYIHIPRKGGRKRGTGEWGRLFVRDVWWLALGEKEV